MADPRRRSRAALSRSLEKPLIALQGAITGDALIKAVFALLERAAPCDFVGGCLRIEPHSYGDVPFRMLDSRGLVYPREILEGAFFQEHPATPLLIANPGIKFINTREVLPPDEVLHATRFYREAMQVIGFRHAIGMYFWEDPPGPLPEVVFAPCRDEGQPDFADEEVAVFERLYPHIDSALRRGRAIDQERAVRKELHRLIDPARATCVLHWDLTVAEANRPAREMCARWNDGSTSACLKPPPFSLPAPLRDACAELKERWSASLQHHPERGGLAERLSVQHPERPSLRALLSLHVHRTVRLGKPALLIEFEPLKHAVPGQRRTNGQNARPGFTLRERELVRLVCEGKNNQEIAVETGKALGSVKNALSAIFGKAGVRSRSSLIARMGGGLHAGMLFLADSTSDASLFCLCG